MDAAIKQLLEIDIVLWIATGLIIISCVVCIIGVLAKFLSILGVPIKWFQGRNKDHELIMDVSDKLNKLTDKQQNDVALSIAHDEKLGIKLTEFMTDIRTSVDEIKKEQTTLIDSMDNIIESNKVRDNAIMEEMCDRIGQKTRRYIELCGIPEDEYDDFVRLYEAYKGIGGNHGAEEKYKYCINSLPILPVDKKIVEKV